jgi:hypothetical protein
MPRTAGGSSSPATKAVPPLSTTRARPRRARLDALNRLSGQTSKTRGDQKELAEATKASGDSADTAGDQESNYAKQLDAVSKSADDAKKETDSFKLSLDILTGAHIDLATVQAAFYDAVSQSKGAVKDLSGKVLDAAGNLNIQSEAGRKAQDVLFNIRDKTNLLDATMAKQGFTAEQVQAKDAELRESFIKSAMQMGINRQHAEDLANQILGIPADRNTNITADTVQASGVVAALQEQIDKLMTDHVVHLSLIGQTGNMIGGLGFAAARAAGGHIRGPGGPTDDRAGLYALSDGEYVVRSASVAKYGVDFFDALNAGRMAGGGLIHLIANATDAGFGSGLAALNAQATAQAQKALASMASFSGTGAGLAVHQDHRAGHRRVDGLRQPVRGDRLHLLPRVRLEPARAEPDLERVRHPAVPELDVGRLRRQDDGRRRSRSATASPTCGTATAPPTPPPRSGPRTTGTTRAAGCSRATRWPTTAPASRSGSSARRRRRAARR